MKTKLRLKGTAPSTSPLLPCLCSPRISHPLNIEDRIQGRWKTIGIKRVKLSFFWRQCSIAIRATTKALQTIRPQPDFTIAKSKLFIFFYVSGRKEAKVGQQSSCASHQFCQQITTITRMVDEPCNISDSCGINIHSHTCLSRWKMLPYN